MLLAPRPSVGFALLHDSGLLPLLLPELSACVGVMQNRFHAFDVHEHTIRAIDAVAAEPRLRWAALAHDLGKPATRVELPNGEATFHGHAQKGAEITDRMLDRLRLPRDERAAIVLLVREHLFDYRAEWTDAAVRRFVRRVGEDALPDLFALRRADAAATRPGPHDLTALDALAGRIAAVMAQRPPLAVRDLAVDGGDAMRVLGVAPGPAVGRALSRLLEEALDDPATNDRARQLARLAELAREAAGGAGGSP
jgi:putative nucleotidyltransferase with HDIG domain